MRNRDKWHPKLLAWMRYEAPLWHGTLASVLNALPWRLGMKIGNSRPARATVYRSYHRAEAAYKGLLLLGTNAVSATPELASMAQDQSRPQTANRARPILRKVRQGADAAVSDEPGPHLEAVIENFARLLAAKRTNSTAPQSLTNN